MHHFILWAGFAGAWLLVAGPVYQASLELRDEEFERERLEEVDRRLRPVEPVSPWWWLVPPVHLILSRRRREERQHAMMIELADEDYLALLSFMNKATGWLMVGAGGLLIATKETYELLEGNEWPEWLLAVIVPVMLALAFAYTVFRSFREREILKHRERAKAPEPDA